MFFIIKYSIAFICSFLILSIPINDRDLFTHIHEATAPFSQEFISVLKRNSSRAIEESKEVGKRAFSNTKPSLEKHKDKVNSVQSSSKREAQYHEDYTEEEKDLLRRVLEKAR